MPNITRRTLMAGSVAVGWSAKALAQGPTKLRLAHGHPEVDPVHTAALRLSELVKQRTNGAVEIQVFANGVLGSDPTMISSVRGGTLEICWTGNPFFTGIAPKLNVLDLPFLFRDREHVGRVLDGPIGDALRAELLPSNLVALATWEVGWRNITNSKRPVRTPADTPSPVAGATSRP